jgi:hypothetical protein
MLDSLPALDCSNPYVISFLLDVVKGDSVMDLQSNKHFLGLGLNSWRDLDFADLALRSFHAAISQSIQK